MDGPGLIAMGTARVVGERWSFSPELECSRSHGWTLADTLFGEDSKMLQHKIFRILALGIGTVEWLQWAG